MAKDTEHQKPPKQFGIFYPRGYVVVALRTMEDAERMGQALRDGGYEAEDIKILDTARVLAGSSSDLEHLNPLVRALGTESDLTAGHQAGAALGHTFVIVYAPSDLDTSRVMNVARRIGFAKAQKYDRFTVTTL